MMEYTIEFSIIIPSYMEEENLRIILPRLYETLTSIGSDYEILIVDTIKSNDNTKLVCENFEYVRYINREGSNTYGSAVRTGIANAKGKYTIFMDADGSHSPEFIPTIIGLRNEYDVIIASRYIKGGNTDNSKGLILMSLVVNVIYGIILNLPYKDISNSFKLYRTDILKKINLHSNNFDIVEEILLKLKRGKADLKVKEIPFTFKERLFGHTKRNLFVFALSYIVTLIRLRFSK